MLNLPTGDAPRADETVSPVERPTMQQRPRSSNSPAREPFISVAYPTADGVHTFDSRHNAGAGGGGVANDAAAWQPHSMSPPAAVPPPLSDARPAPQHSLRAAGSTSPPAALHDDHAARSGLLSPPAPQTLGVDGDGDDGRRMRGDVDDGDGVGAGDEDDDDSAVLPPAPAIPLDADLPPLSASAAPPVQLTMEQRALVEEERSLAADHVRDLNRVLAGTCRLTRSSSSCASARR